MYKTLFATTVLGIFSIAELANARAGGGGSSSGGGGGGGSFSGSSSYGGGTPADAWLIVGITSVIFIIIGISVYQRRKAVQKTKADLAVAAKSDPKWQERDLIRRVEEVFFIFQNAWAKKDPDAMRTILSAEYYKRMVLEISVLKNLHRTNTLENPVIVSCHIQDMTDVADSSGDKFTAHVNAKGKDVLWDDLANKEIYHENSSFTEDWHFVREDNRWVLGVITQATADPRLEDQKIADFAKQNGFYFDPDFGWLMLPQKGVLFSKASFLRSDINNHVVGYYRNKIVEFYTYAPRANGGERQPYYLIAQAILPIHHTDIVVERKKLINWPKRGLRRMSLESVDFNNKFCLWAHPADMSRPLELLTPNFMEKIYNLPIEINIEVVDNVLYLYAKNRGVQNYGQMLEVLSWAFDEMKM